MNCAQAAQRRRRDVKKRAPGSWHISRGWNNHKTPAVKRWLARHKRFTLHFTPTSCSWLNLVERLFAEITRQRIRRGTFNDVIELKTAIDEWIEHRNQNPKPFKWTASAKSILAKHRRAKKALAIAKAGCK